MDITTIDYIHSGSHSLYLLLRNIFISIILFIYFRFFENFYADKGLGESVNCKTVIKKKKSKRKSKKGEEHVNAKRLRNDLANNVEDFNFSEANFSEMTS